MLTVPGGRGMGSFTHTIGIMFFDLLESGKCALFILLSITCWGNTILAFIGWIESFVWPILSMCGLTAVFGTSGGMRVGCHLPVLPLHRMWSCPILTTSVPCPLLYIVKDYQMKWHPIAKKKYHTKKQQCDPRIDINHQLNRKTHCCAACNEP